MGRITIPTRLREQFGLEIGQTYHFLTHEENGRNYICIDCGSTSPLSKEDIIKLAQQNGLKFVDSDD